MADPKQKEEPSALAQAFGILSQKLGDLFPMNALAKTINPPPKKLTPEEIARRKREKQAQQAQLAGSLARGRK